MKRATLLSIFFIGIVSTAFSQKVINEKIEVDNKQTFMEFKFADNIVIVAWDKNYIELKVEVNIDDNKYNEHYKLDINKSGKTLKFVEEIDFKKIKELKGNKKNCNMNTDLHYSLKVPRELEIDLETISGEVELIGCQGQMQINSISGFIDYSIPKNHKANIDLSTISGDVYSNVKFDTKASKEISWVGTKEKLSLNGGNTGVKLKTISGDIYLRKQ